MWPRVSHLRVMVTGCLRFVAFAPGHPIGNANSAISTQAQWPMRLKSLQARSATHFRSRLGWQLLDELQRPLDPAAQRLVGFDAAGRHQHPALHRLAGDVE